MSSFAQCTDCLELQVNNKQQNVRVCFNATACKSVLKVDTAACGA